MRHPRLALLLFVFATCGGINHITVNQSASATIPGATILEQFVGDVGFGSLVSFDLTQSQELKNQGVKREQIDSVKLQTLSLTITAPANGQDFTFLDSISFFVDAPGQAHQEIAKAGPFAQGTRTINLTVLDVELAPYATATSMTFSTAVKGRKPSSQTTLEAKIAIGVDVNIGGLLCGGK